MVSVVCLSVCRLSETFVFPTQRVKIFGNIFTRFRTLGIWGGPCKISQRSAQGNPSNEGVECKGYDKMTIFSQISRSITETVKVIDGTCSETICKHRILFRSIQHLAWLPQGRPQGKQKCGKYSCNITGNTCNITRNTCNITGNTCNITRNTCNITKNHLQHYKKHVQHYRKHVQHLHETHATLQASASASAVRVRRIHKAGYFCWKVTLPVLLTLSDPRLGVLTPTDPQTAENMGVMT